MNPAGRRADSLAQLEAIALVKELDERERAERKQLKETRKELYAAVTAALDEHDVPVHRLHLAINRSRDSLYRWRDQTRAAKRDQTRAASHDDA